MHLNAEERVKEIEKKFIKVQILEAPGTIMFGLGLYGKFGADGNAFHPFLNDPTNINILLIIGASIMAWGGYKSLTLLREKASLKKKHGI